MEQPTPARPSPHAATPARGLTLIEMLIVLVCLGIVAMLAIPAAGQREAARLSQAARTLEADLQYARHTTLSDARNPLGLVLDEQARSYDVVRVDEPGEPIEHPSTGQPYRVTLGRDADDDAISLHVEGVDQVLAFGWMGGLQQSEPAQIHLSGQRRQLTLEVDPITGQITGQD